MHEDSEPDALVDLFDSDLLAGEDLAEVDLLSVEADAAAAQYCSLAARAEPGVESTFHSDGA